MSARDVFHNQAKNAPKNADWHVTNDPFSFRIGREPFHIDLGDCRMDRMKQQQESVTQLITRFASYKPAFGDVEMQAITDHEHGHYQVMSIGWEKDERVHDCVMHLDIKDGKIWIQHNATDVDIAEELVEQGLSKAEIVLAMHPTRLRPYTGYAVN